MPDPGDPHDVVPGDVLPDGRIAGAPDHRFTRRAAVLGGGAALVGAGFAAGRMTAAPTKAHRTAAPTPAAARPSPSGGWDAVSAQFAAVPDQVALNGFVLGLPPEPVRDAVAAYRERLDREGVAYLEREGKANDDGVRQAAARYLGTTPELVALTDSTTMGLGIVYGGALLRPGDELLTSDRDFYSTQESMRYAAARTGATVRTIRLYDAPATVRAADLVGRVMAAVTDRTRMIGVTWVHSGTGLKFPVRALAARLAEHNRSRPRAQRALLVVDGVHGLGVQPEVVSRLGCDVFVSGTHKWLYGPRGTGIVWARREAWRRIAPVIPTFDPAVYEAWREGRPSPLGTPTWAAAATPGGFHSFENRWALAEAFDFHARLGRQRIARRIASLTEQLRSGLKRIPKVRIVSPEDPGLRSSIVCFDVDGLDPRAVVDRIAQRGVQLSVTPYPELHVRAGCPLWVGGHGVERALREVARV